MARFKSFLYGNPADEPLPDVCLPSLTGGSWSLQKTLSHEHIGRNNHITFLWIIHRMTRLRRKRSLSSAYCSRSR